MEQVSLKQDVRDFWNKASCGEVYAQGEDKRQYYEEHSRQRYALEPYIYDFARFEEGRGRDVLEIGVGMGADHLEWAKNSPKQLTGVDLTPRAIEHTTERLAVYGLSSRLQTADAENLPFDDNSFDLVYSWGVLHHTPQTPKAIQEVHRVLRPGGIARIMIYHTYSLTGYMLWARYALLAGKPFRDLHDIYFHHLESPGTKAYTVDEAKAMCASFAKVDARVQLSFGDLLEGSVGQRHQGALLTIAKRLWPRELLKKWLPNHGLMLLIEATK